MAVPTAAMVATVAAAAVATVAVTVTPRCHDDGRPRWWRRCVSGPKVVLGVSRWRRWASLVAQVGGDCIGCGGGRACRRWRCESASVGVEVGGGVDNGGGVIRVGGGGGDRCDGDRGGGGDSDHGGVTGPGGESGDVAVVLCDRIGPWWRWCKRLRRGGDGKGSRRCLCFPMWRGGSYV